VDPRAAARSKLIVALDVPSQPQAMDLVKRIGSRVGLFKVGLELFVSTGPSILDVIRQNTTAGIFLDLKFHDIPATMRAAGLAAKRYGVRFLTVHCETSERLAAPSPGLEVTQFLGVTVLTSTDADAMQAAGWYKPGMTVADLVRRRAVLARNAGCAGVVCSANEARAIKNEFGPDFLVVTPGIRPAWAVVPADDQRRAATPAEAVAAGADFIVVGRPVRDAKDPAEAVERIVDEIGETLDHRS
jgi:orotidine-5'-phosphate decarboxylase